MLIKAHNNAYFAYKIASNNAYNLLIKRISNNSSASAAQVFVPRVYKDDQYHLVACLMKPGWASAVADGDNMQEHYKKIRGIMLQIF